MLYNYHTHTLYCDGSSQPEEYCSFAVKSGMKQLGFSGHAPVDFENNWSIRAEELIHYLEHIRKCRETFKDLEIFLALEADYIPSVSPEFSYWLSMGLDYLIGSVHLVKAPHSDELWFIDGPAVGYDTGLKKLFDNDIKAAVTAFFEQSREMLLTQKPDIIGHIDKIKMHNRDRFFTTADDWYCEEIEKTLQVIKSSSCIVEVNTRGKYKGKTTELFPSEPIIKRCFELDIPVVISTDAHLPEELCKLGDYAKEVLLAAGYTKALKKDHNGWVEYSLL